MKKIWIGQAVNVLVVVSSVAALATSITTFARMRTQQHRAEQLAPQVGSVFALPGEDWAVDRITMVAALSSGCHACNESIPFYRKLFPAVQAAGVPLVVITADPNPQQTQEHFEELGVRIPEIRGVRLESHGIRATPTVLVVDSRAKIKRVWLGAIPPGRENEVLKAVGATGKLR